jgi:hypothetical protein
VIIEVNIGGTDISADIIYNSARVKFLTEDDEHSFGMNSVTCTVSNINGVRADMLLAEKRPGAIRLLGRQLLDVIVETVNENRDEETIELTLLAADRKVLDQLKDLKILDFKQDNQGLWTLFEGAAQYRVWTRVDKILERALASIGLDLNWDIRQLGTAHLMM